MLEHTINLVFEFRRFLGVGLKLSLDTGVRIIGAISAKFVSLGSKDQLLVSFLSGPWCCDKSYEPRFFYLHNLP